MKNKNIVVLVAPVNPNPSPDYFGPPYGLALISSMLKKAGRKVKCFDFEKSDLTYQASCMERIIQEYKPRFIGISIQSVLRYSAYVLIKHIKNIDSSITVILGGSFASLKYGFLLDNFPIDYVVVGDGEYALVELLNEIDAGGNLESIKGIAFKRDGRLVVTPKRSAVLNLDKLPYPDFDVFNLSKELSLRDYRPKIKKRVNAVIDSRKCKLTTSLRTAVMLLSSRGCPFSCLFCPMSYIAENKLRLHSPEYFVKMVRFFYRKYNLRDFVFGDNFFTFDRKRVIDICDKIRKSNLKINWMCMTRPDYVDKPLLRAMARAGCLEISYGVESGSPCIQKSIDKNLDLTKTIEAFKHTQQAGIRSILMLMVGNPGESEQTIKQTQVFIRNLSPDNILVHTTKVYPGNKLHDIAVSKKLIDDSYYLKGDHQPPLFTVEHSKENLVKFASFLAGRNTFIYTTSDCNNHCPVCNLNMRACEASSPSGRKIRQILTFAKDRSDAVILSGGEFLLRKDSFDLLRFAQSIGLHRIFLETNGRILCYQDCCNMLRDYGVAKIILPFFFLDSGLYDKFVGVPGAFNQVIQGMENCMKSGLKTEVNIFINSSNFSKLSEITKFLTDLCVSSVNYVFVETFNMKKSFHDLPTYGSIVDILEQARISIEKDQKDISLEGFPFCVLTKRLRDKTRDINQPFNEIINFDGSIVNCRVARMKKKIKPHFCLSCEETELCEGVWRRYYERYRSSINKAQRVL